ncbi:MAG: DUF6391 domain-containing protein [Anaerolineae bacterium]
MDILSRIPLVSKVRRNHALEHATIHILNQRYPHIRLMGRSAPGGFYIYGDIGTEIVRAAAEEALARLKRGEKGLAVHPRCGTNLATAGVLAGLSAFFIMSGRSRSRLAKLPEVLFAATVAVILAQPLGWAIQKHITTSTELDGVFIRGVFRQAVGGIATHRVDVGQE